jgi:hypothetical protein
MAARRPRQTCRHPAAARPRDGARGASEEQGRRQDRSPKCTWPAACPPVRLRARGGRRWLPLHGDHPVRDSPCEPVLSLGSLPSGAHNRDGHALELIARHCSARDGSLRRIQQLRGSAARQATRRGVATFQRLFGPLVVLAMNGVASYDPAPARMVPWHGTSFGKDLGRDPRRPPPRRLIHRTTQVPQKSEPCMPPCESQVLTAILTSEYAYSVQAHRGQHQHSKKRTAE